MDVFLNRAKARSIQTIFTKPAVTPDELVHQGVISLTASQAGLLARECLHPLQKKARNPDSSTAELHIRALADVMQRGKWIPHSRINFAVLNGKYFLADGNHRLRAQALSGKTIEWDCKIHKIDTQAEFSNLFYSFDTILRPRTANQVLAAADFASKHQLSGRAAKALNGAVVLIRQNFSVGKKDRDYTFARVYERRLDFAAKYAGAMRKFESSVKYAEARLRSKLYTSGCTAVALITFDEQPVKAQEFWSGVCANDGLRRGDPRHTLIQDLLSRPLNSGASQQVMVVPSVAWNAFFDGRTLNKIKVHASSEVSIAGTSYER